MTTEHPAYHKLRTLSTEIAHWKSISRLLEWDQETQMPPAGAEVRANQLALLAKRIHTQSTSPELQQALGELVDLETGQALEELPEPQQAELRAWHRDFRLANALSSELVSALAHLRGEACDVWREAREQSNFARLQPYLEEMFALQRQKADQLGYVEHPYDALLDLHEAGLTCHTLNHLFGQLRQPLQQLWQERAAQPQPTIDYLTHTCPRERQILLGYQMIEALGFDASRHCLHFSTHPFCESFHPHDTRITSRIDERKPTSHLFVLLHEGGHLLYDSGLPAEQFGSPLGEAVSTALHESQSRLWECVIGKSRPFWQHFFPLLQQTFPHFHTITLDDFLTAIHQSVITPVRLESDDVAYSLHIMVRYELEKQLIEGSLAVKDLPDAWREKMDELLGVEVPSDREGCLQDIHWPCGLVGYFPTYALGNFYAAQFFEVFQQEHPDWPTSFAKGDFTPLQQWLAQNIYQHGRRYTPQELIQRICGQPLSVDAYLKQLANTSHG